MALQVREINISSLSCDIQPVNKWVGKGRRGWYEHTTIINAERLVNNFKA